MSTARGGSDRLRWGRGAARRRRVRCAALNRVAGSAGCRALAAVFARRRRATRSVIGKRAERRAERYLRRRGLRLLARNYATRFGEIDLVMRDGVTVAFVEVRFRGPGAWNDGVESVNFAKMQRIARAARRFLAANPRYAEDAARFDVVAVSKTRLGTKCEWVPDAFDAPLE